MTTAEQIPEGSLARTPLQTVLAFIDRYNDSDSDGMWALMSPDFTRVSASTGWEKMGRDMYRDMSKRWNAAFDDNRWQLIDIVVKDATVVCEFYESAVFRRPWAITDTRTVESNGKSYRARATVWFTVNQIGLISTYRYYSDGGFQHAYGEEIAKSGSNPLRTAT